MSCTCHAARLTARVGTSNAGGLRAACGRVGVGGGDAQCAQYREKSGNLMLRRTTKQLQCTMKATCGQTRKRRGEQTPPSTRAQTTSGGSLVVVSLTV